MSVSLLALPIFVLGMDIGSFLNVVALRTVSGKRFYYGRSECMHCQSKINWFDNIPIFSFLILKGKCRSCNQSISLQYPLVEFVTGVVFMLLFIQNIDLQHQFIFLFLSAILILISVIDILEKSIYQSHLYILFALVIVFRIFLEPIGSLIDLFYGPLTFGGFLAVLRWIGGKIYKKEAMGIGDVKLAVVLGFMLSLKLAVVALYTSFISASIVGVYLIASKRKSERIIPFAPFLSLGAITAYFFGQNIIYWIF